MDTISDSSCVKFARMRFDLAIKLIYYFFCVSSLNTAESDSSALEAIQQSTILSHTLFVHMIGLSEIRDGLVSRSVCRQIGPDTEVTTRDGTRVSLSPGLEINRK